MKFGKVTELGQFVSDFDPDPDHNKKKLSIYHHQKTEVTFLFHYTNEEYFVYFCMYVEIYIASF